MDIQAYIASGKLENYLLGLLTPEEEREVERVAEEYPAIRAELNALEEALETYAQANAMAMPEGLTERILSNLESQDKMLSKTAPGSAKSSPWASLLLMFALLTATGIAFYLLRERNQLRKEKAFLESAYQELESACADTSDKLSRMEQQLKVLRNPENRSIILEGTAKAPNSEVVVFYNTEQQRSFLDVRQLAAPPTGKQYQLWAIVDGQAVDMGVFDLQIDGDSTFLEVPYIPEAQAFAITLEDPGGKPSPTLSEMVVQGET